MEKKAVAIIGSSRSHGNTRAFLDFLIGDLDISVIDINDLKISPYDYQHQNQNDDFLPLMKKLINDYETFIFATPVYWYTYSCQMKMFLDRFSDFLTLEKNLGRQLRSKNTLLVTTGASSEAPKCLIETFRLTFSYLGLNILGELYQQQPVKDKAIDQKNCFEKYLAH